ncbi:type VI secretion system baseplate subunit TssK [Flexibacterium corallicola]|uniref:type VI secretion system baseplate subunit TssK n=1 Tax=Flexibacterium corallicola TaxID=3037259 RepID=UPI00286EBF4D|nr:type VI secretion system baseplate subunit TssK [Pseudovibrio sp. M1P-2-3]
MVARIVWTEGMFIAPQHFQHSDKSIRAYVDAVSQLDLRGSDYGVSSLELNDNALQIGKISIRKAAGVFPDRLYFELIQELTLDVPEGTVDEIVYLAVPLAVYGACEFGPSSGQHRYATSPQELRDLRDTDNEAVETEVAAVGVTLKLGTSDLSGFATIPVARILEKSAQGRVILDRSYIPRALSIEASSVLMERLDEILSLAGVRATNAASRIESQLRTHSESSLFSERMELQILNSSLLALQNLLANTKLSAREFYNEAGGLLVKLEAMQARTTDPSLVYDPTNMGGSFEGVFGKLRAALTLEHTSKVETLGWNRELFEKRRLLRVVVPTRLLGGNYRPVLALSGPDGAAHLSEIGSLACKLAGLSSMPELVSHGLPGVELAPLATPPAELRNRSDAAFFSIGTSSALWQRYLEKHEALALHVDDRIQSLDATLYLLD